MIDGDRTTKWQIDGQPANVTATFTLDRTAEVTGDAIDVSGTGGGRDVTEYVLLVRDGPNQDWTHAVTVSGSVTGDGDDRANHTFDEPVVGKEFKLVLTEHTPPSGCLSVCDVPIAEYELFGEFVDDDGGNDTAFATVFTNADTDGDGREDELSLRAAPDQEIRGTVDTAHVPISAQPTVRVTSVSSASPFLKSLPAFVTENGTFTATGNFSDVDPGTPFAVDVRYDGESLLAGEVDGRVEEATTSASVTLNDQTVAGTNASVTVASASLPGAGFVAVHEGSVDGASSVLGKTGDLAAGSHRDVSVALAGDVSNGTTLVAALHPDTNGNGVLDREEANEPVTAAGSVVSDEATLTVAGGNGDNGTDGNETGDGSSIRDLPASVTPGGEVTVTLETTTDAETTVSFEESFSPAVESATIESVTVDGQPVPTVLSTADSKGVVVTVDGVPAGATVTVTYTLTVAGNATAGSTYAITGDLTTGGETGAIGREVLTVREGSPLDGPAGRYDDDADGEITVTELGDAAAAYARGEIPIAKLGDVASAYARS